MADFNGDSEIFGLKTQTWTFEISQSVKAEEEKKKEEEKYCKSTGHSKPNDTLKFDTWNT